MANARPPLRSHVQIASDSDSSDSDSEDDLVQTEAAPARFMGDSDDLFMRSVINSYSSEGADGDGAPNGVFTMSEG